MRKDAVEAVCSVYGEIAVGAGDAGDALVLADVELIVLGALAVVLQRLGARGLLVRAAENGMSPISSSSGVVKKVMCAG